MCAIVENGLKKFAPILRHHGYRGMIDLNAIVNDEGVWGLEWTPRTGYDAFPTLMEMLTEGVGSIIAKYARGERVAKFPMRETGFGGGVRVTIPPYPSDFPAPEGVPIRELIRADRAHSFFYNVLLDDEGVLRSSGAFGAIATFTGFGDDIYRAMEGPLEIAKRLELQNKQFRTDLAGVFQGYYDKYLTLSGHSKSGSEGG
jgi:phosphoribosylamine--glycine ligase